MWKILTAQIREEIYYSLISRGLFPNEQKGCRKGSRGTAELLYIDEHVLNESKNRRKNLAMAWIDYKKAYDMVPQSWITNCLKMYANIDYANKWYMHNPAPVLENDTHKLLWDFDHLISARRPDLIIINKKKKKENLQNCRLCCPGRPQNKTERVGKER